MKGVAVFAVIAVVCTMQVYAADEAQPPKSFDEVRTCLRDLSRINEENKKTEDILVEVLYENLYRALACVEVLSDLEDMEITASQEKELQDWQAEMEKEEGNEK